MFYQYQYYIDLFFDFTRSHEQQHKNTNMLMLKCFTFNILASILCPANMDFSLKCIGNVLQEQAEQLDHQRLQFTHAHQL